LRTIPALGPNIKDNNHCIHLDRIRAGIFRIYAVKGPVCVCFRVQDQKILGAQ